ncbi:hypothetical protein V502_09251 [Pseudogymnoascus sp. VKM F-4520 (FW-2644)]|nr:hypothetical protein V502_09251 [Pseudogymnoascus sp. VKM F-4520 (FW-2644)]
MSGNPSVEELLRRNAQKARSHRPIPSLSEISQQPPEQQVPMPKIFIDCSAELFKNDDVRETLKERAPAHNSAIDELGLPGFDDLEQSVRDDVTLVHKSPLLRKELAERTHGFVYDITTGKVTLVV